MDNMNQKVVIWLRSEISRCIKELLEKKHLYQSVRIGTAHIQEMIDDADNSPEVKSEEKRVHRLAAASSGPGVNTKQRAEQFLQKYRQGIKDTADHILNQFWSFSTDACEHLLLAIGGETSDSITHFTLPTISLTCAQCDANLPAHNSGFRGQQQEIQTVNWQVPKNGQPTPFQTFIFPYQCQSCKKEPLIFLVHREGDKLILAGRNHFETVLTSKTIPEQENQYFSDAIVAYNTGNVLAGLFLLRTTLEQYMRRLLSITGKKSGDELSDDYARFLDDEFPKRYPSLKMIYNELSGSLHAASKNTVQFEKSRKDIEQHFELLKHFPLKADKIGNIDKT